jgi:hypothetical protein
VCPKTISRIWARVIENFEHPDAFIFEAPKTSSNVVVHESGTMISQHLEWLWIETMDLTTIIATTIAIT